MKNGVRGHSEPPCGRRARRARLLVWALASVLVLVAAVAFALLRSGDREAAPKSPETVSPSPRTSLRTVFTAPPNVAKPRDLGDPGRVGLGTSDPAVSDFVPGRLIIKFEDDARPEAVQRVLAGLDGELEAQVDPLDVHVVDVPPAQTNEALAEAAASPAVEYVERDAAVRSFATPNDTLWGEQWGPLMVDGPEAWNAATGSPGIVVAVLDTGIDGTHPDLQSSLVPGYDFVNGDSDASDDQGHGTASAGIIAARTNNGRGQAGICWRCSLMPVKVLDANGSGSTSVVAAGIVWAVDHGARVISLSLGGEDSTQTLSDAVAYAVGKGVILVASAGNSGNSNLNYPAAYEGVIAVAGTTATDELYSWSNFGPWVHVAAPGCNVAAYLNGEYVNFCGTSSAGPIVAGIAALALSAKPAASRAEIENALTLSVAPLGTAVRHGRVSANRTLQALGVQPAAKAPAPVAAPPPAATPTPAATPSPPVATPPAPTTAPAAAVPAPAAPTRLRGRLTPGGLLRLGVRRLSAGQVTATLTAPGNRGLTLMLLDSRGKAIARATGPTPLRLSHSVTAGNYRFVVRGSKRGPFTLSVASRS
jgi:subtilisin family serine protease